MKSISRIIFGITCISLIIVACQKIEIDNETQSAKDNSYAEMSFSQIAPVVNQIGIDEEGVEKMGALETCATITIEETQGSADGFPKTVEVDYGVACTGNDGRIRSGKVLMVFYTNWSNSLGCEVDVTLENYHINTVKHEGSFNIVKSINSNGKLELTVTLSGGKIHTQQGVVEYESTRTTEWLEGDSTTDISDDIIKVYGNSSGVNREGRSFTTKIVEALKRDMSCDYISEGVIELTPEGLATRTIDFGDGTCDNLVTITVNDNTIEIPIE